MSNLLTGPWHGRFFTPRTRIAMHQDFRAAAAPRAWSEASSHQAGQAKKARTTWWCTARPPHEGNLGDDTTELAWDDGGTGIWRVWIREEMRSVPKKTLEVEAERRWRAAHGTALFDQRATVREEALEQTRTALFAASTPRVRVIQGLLTPDLIWIDHTNPEGIPALLHPLIGPIDPAPLAWSGPRGEEDAPRWNALSRAALRRVLAREDGCLAPGIRLTEVKLADDAGRFTSENPAVRHHDILKEILELPVSPEILRLGFSLDNGGERILVVLDEQGVLTLAPPRSGGGLLADRVRRRLDDGLAATVLLRESMENAFTEQIRSE